jgi:signal transduction histidine kinase
MAAVVRETNERMERLISSLLALAKGEGGIAQPVPADLGAAVRPSLEREPAFRDGGALRLDALLAPAPALGDVVLLERLAENLVENAVRYSARGGWVSVRTGVGGDRAVLRVANAGDVVAPEEAAQLTEPFRRRESSRARATGGYGLGLAVVRAIAHAHGGDASVEAKPGAGATFRVALPVRGVEAAAGAGGHVTR